MPSVSRFTAAIAENYARNDAALRARTCGVTYISFRVKHALSTFYAPLVNNLPQMNRSEFAKRLVRVYPVETRPGHGSPPVEVYCFTELKLISGLFVRALFSSLAQKAFILCNRPPCAARPSRDVHRSPSKECPGCASCATGGARLSGTCVCGSSRSNEPRCGHTNLP